MVIRRLKKVKKIKKIIVATSNKPSDDKLANYLKKLIFIEENLMTLLIDYIMLLLEIIILFALMAIVH